MRKQQMRRCGDRKGFVVLQELKEDKNGPGGGAGPGEPFKKGNVLETAMLSCRQVLQLGVDMLQDEWLLWVGRGRVETRHQSGDP